MARSDRDTHEDIARFVAAHGEPLGRLAYQLTGDVAAASDLVQDVFERVVRSWPKPARARNQRAYVRRMLVNRHLDVVRGRLSTVPLERPERDPSAMALPDNVVELDAMWRALADLSPRQRTVLVLRHYEQLPDREIAGILAARPATVRSLAARGLQALRYSPHLELWAGQSEREDRSMR